MTLDEKRRKLIHMKKTTSITISDLPLGIKLETLSDDEAVIRYDPTMGNIIDAAQITELIDALTEIRTTLTAGPAGVTEVTKVHDNDGDTWTKRQNGRWGLSSLSDSDCWPYAKVSTAYGPLTPVWD